MPRVTKDRYVVHVTQWDVPHLKPEAAFDHLRPNRNMEPKTKKQLIESPQGDLAPHVVLLGAGASRAAFPNGDRSGKIIPLMDDLVEVIGLGPIIKQAGMAFGNESNFEVIYSKLASNPRYANTTRKIEQKVEAYFSSLKLPNEATIYDRILLSLRKEDAVFTFNWDPFLFDAYQRNCNIAPLPTIHFLHGNVRIGQCPNQCRNHQHWWAKQGRCPVCSARLKGVPLLYPVVNKGYSNDPYINKSREVAKEMFRKALVLTIFGYGAPDSDRDAVELLKSAWMARSDRETEHVEIIDIVSERLLYKRWEAFTPTFHLQRRQNFSESWIAGWPRRSREAVWSFMSSGLPCQKFPLVSAKNLSQLQKQIRDIAKSE